MNDSSGRLRPPSQFSSKFSLPVQTPVRQNQLMSRINDSARKLDLMEKSQIDKLKRRLESQKNEIRRLEEDVKQAELSKEEYLSKLVSSNRTFQTTIETLMDTLSAADGANKDLAAENSSLIDQLALVPEPGDPKILEKRILDLEQELSRIHAKPLPESPSEKDALEEVKKTKKILKQQCQTAETYQRNSVKFEMDEARARIRRLQKTVSSLSQQQRDLKNDLSKLDAAPTPQQGKLEELCCAIEDSSSSKDVLIAALKEENARRKRDLEKVVRREEELEREIRIANEKL